MTSSKAEVVVGIVGVGAMGSIIARHLSSAGWRLKAWDRSPESVRAIAGDGIQQVGSISDLGDCSVVLSVVFDDEATREVSFGSGGLIEVMAPDAVHVTMASITPALSRQLSDSHAEKEQLYLAASMFGRPEAAEAAQLFLNCSGSDRAYDRAEPLLRRLGNVRWLGTEPEKAMLVKAIGNSMITAAGEMVREIFRFLEAGGIDKQLGKELLIDTLFPGPIFDGGARRHIADPGLPRMTAIARKDRNNCLAAAQKLGVDLPLLSFLASEDLP
jgi:3-hydroxyisobutyrate dehydrogenase-like beta-hydroxyacid dehydrogenase